MSLVLRSWLAVACALPIVMVWAFLVALVSRFRWKVSQWFLPMFAGPFLFVFLVLIVDLLCGTPFQFNNARAIWQIMHSPMFASVTLMTVDAVAIIAHLLATSILPYFGLRRYRDGAPSARQWPLKRLSLGLLGSVGLLALTVVIQSWIVCGIARRTSQEITQAATGWLPTAEDKATAEQPPALPIILDEAAKSDNPAFKVAFSPYRPLKNVPVRKELELGNKLARLHFEALEGVLRETPFRPATNDLLAWDRGELTGFEAILNAARLATIIAIEEADHERVIRYLNAIALCSDQLRAYSDVDCLVLSMSYAATRSALLERWFFEGAPSGQFVARIEPLKGTDFTSHREAMLRQLEATILYEHARMLLGEKPWQGDNSRIWLVKEASRTTGDPTLILDRVIYGADNLLLTPKVFSRYRPRFLVPTKDVDDFGHIWTHPEWGGQSSLVWSSFPTFSTLCYRLPKEDTREFITNVALQVEQFRQKEKKYPNSLAELVPQYLPQLPLDPFDDQPLRYLREGDGGAIIYSIDGDHRDQQIGDPDYRGDRTEADIVFCLGEAYRLRRIPKPEG